MRQVPKNIETEVSPLRLESHSIEVVFTGLNLPELKVMYILQGKKK